jgi:HEPN domain-containing protein
MLKKDLQSLADNRVKDAQCLLKAKLYSGAYYLAGYSIELALKACIAKLFRANTIPDKKLVNSIFTHSLKDLLRIAGLEQIFKTDQQKDGLLSTNWAIVCDWSEESRYTTKTKTEATDLINAITDPKHGVLPWLKQHY